MVDKPIRSYSHFYLPGHGEKQDYTAHQAGGSNSSGPPQRDREAHANHLTQALTSAVRSGEAILKNRNPRLSGGVPGFYLEFELPEGQTDIVERLENRRSKFPIELVNVKPVADKPDKITATVFVPEQQRDYYLNKVAAFRDEDSKPNTEGITRPKNETLVAAIDTARLAVMRSLYTDNAALFPEDQQTVWWEVWLRSGTRTVFDIAVQQLRLPMREHALTFPDREVVLVAGTVEQLGKIVINTDCVAELRLARDTPNLFLKMNSGEQRQWSDELARLVLPPPPDAPAVCLLDSGTTARHPLIRCGLNPVDQQAYDQNWSPEDNSRQPHGGHGTELSGLILHGDLTDLLMRRTPLPLGHRLESVKILPDHGANVPDLYGAITARAIATAEITAPQRPRAICLATTSDGDHWRGRPSAWSAELDRLTYGEEDIRRLIVVAAGNIRDQLHPEAYPDRNDTMPIESPAQAWNVLTVGAYTEKITIVDPQLQGWRPFAPIGGLTPSSRTSVSWHLDWPFKPDVVFEGGNLGINPATGASDTIDDLALLTTFRTPEERPFTTTRDTSGATALAARMAAQILAERPQLWPETVRALIVHSASWTPAMLAHSSKVAHRLRCYGFGVPSLQRALHSLDNDVTLVIENTMQPFQAKGSEIKTKDMVLHKLPWPKATLQRFGNADVEMRVTLSYFIEPNPGERGYVKRHSYASHGLRFDVQRSNELPEVLCRRINSQAGPKPKGASPDPDWIVGPRLRARGSLHSDIWKGSAAELAARDAIVVYPTGGWWRENPVHKRANIPVRYSLIVSLRTAVAAPLYIEVQTQIVPEITSEIEIEI